MNKILTGDRCKCQSCGVYFNSTKAFDKHRVGKHDSDDDFRRCLTVAEMSAKGMGENKQGFWVSERFKTRPNYFRADTKQPTSWGAL